MSTVDNRIVNMTFNNRDFERNAAQSTKTLTDLERTLANTGKSQGLQNLGNSAIDVKSKFSAMQVAGVAAIATITAKAVDAGLRIAKSLTIAPLTQGFQEYQTNLNSVQTIISNTGEDVNTVTKYLDKLNRYSDQTVYNFSEMARNIGTFTAAGVDLDTATDSIKGIANLAALSGSNSQQASTAMYQLSQAIAAGRVGLMDWNSVVNAGMGGKIFQTALARTGQSMGKIADGAIGAEGPMKRLTIAGESFRESIGGGDSWLNGDILVETLKQISGGYSDAQLKAKGYTEAQIKDIQDLADTAFKAATNIKTLPQLFQVVQESIGSMWAKTFMLILGDFEQSKELWGNVGAAIVGPNGFVTKLNNGVTGYIKSWAKQGGRDDMLRGFERAFKNVWRLIIPFKNAWQDIFPPSTTNTLVKITKSFKDFAEFLKPSVNTMHNLRSVFRGVFAVLHIGFTVLKGVAGLFGALFAAIFKGAGPGRDGILSVAGAIGETLVALDKFITGGGRFMDIMKEIGNVVGAVIEPLIRIAGEGGQAIAGLFGGFSGGGGLASSVAQIKKAVMDMVYNVLVGLQKLTAPFSGLSDFIGGLADKVSILRRNFSFENQDLLGADGIGKATETISQGMDKVGDTAGKVTDKVSEGFDKFTGATDKAKDSVTGLFDTVGGQSGDAAAATTEGIGNAAETAETGLSKLKSILSAIGTGIAKTFGALGSMFGWVQKQFSDLFGNFDGMDWVSFFNAIFSGALILQIKKTTKAIDDIRTWRKIFDDTFGQLTDTMKTMQNTLRAQTLKAIAVSVALLAASIFLLSYIDAKKLGIGLGAVASLMAILVGTIKVLSSIEAKDGTSITAIAAAFVGMSSAILILSASVAILGNMDLETLAKGIGAIALVLGILVGATYLLGGIKGMLKSAAFGMVLMAGALLLLSAAVYAFGKMDLKTLAKGLGAMAIALGLMVVALLLLGDPLMTIEGSAGAILIVSGAMILLAKAVEKFGKLSIGELAKGLVAMAIGLGLVVAALMIVSSVGPVALAAGAAILLVAFAMEKLAIVIALLGLLPWSVASKGLIIMALALGIVIAAGALALLVLPGLIVLGATLVALGIAMVLAGTGMLLFGTGFAIFAAAGIAGVAVLIAAFHAFMAILPELATQLAASLVAFLKALANASPKIRKSINRIVEDMIGILTDNIPHFTDLGFALLTSFLSGLDDNITEITDSVAGIIEKFMTELGNHSDELSDAGMDMIIDMLNAMANTIETKNGAFYDAIDNLAAAIAHAIEEGFRRYVGDIDWGAILAAAMPKGGGFFGAVMSNRGSTSGKFVNPWEKLTNKIATASTKLSDVLADLFTQMTQGYGEKVLEAAKKFVEAQKLADRASGKAGTADKGADFSESRATAAQKRADRLQKIADKKKATKKQKQEAKDAQKHADKLAKEAEKKRRIADAKASRADLLQTKADARAAKVETEKSVEDAVEAGDFEQAGDIRVDEATDLAKRAQEMLEKSKADQKLAEKLAKGNAKERAQAEKLRKQAQNEARLAGQWAQQARDAMDAATNYYRDAANARMADIIAQHDAAATELADQKAFDEATTQGKSDIMAARAAASDAKAKAAEKAYSDALAAADAAIAAGDFSAAQAALDVAETQSQIAQEAAQNAADQAAQAAQLAEQAEQEAKQSAASGGTAGGGNIQGPSRTALEDAAKSVDRYTQSLSEAEQAAGAGQPVLQFNQVNNSPEALSVSEIYRQGNNMVSLALKKITP